LSAAKSWIRPPAVLCRSLTAIRHFAAAAAFLCLVAGCSSALFDAYTEANPPAQGARGHVYLLRGLIGEVFSRGLDELADKLNKRGVPATVHGLFSAGSLADEIIANFKADPTSGPIVLIGHSSGGDAIIGIAERLNAANVPVGLAFGFDPTPIAGRLPNNVELFVNLFQKTNPIGGGTIRAGAGFQGRLINLDLREHTEIIHITLDKSTKIHELVADLIVDFVAHEKSTQTFPPLAATQSRSKKKNDEESSPTFLRPFFLSYVVPRDQPIEIWDSAFEVRTRGGETLATIAAAYQVPLWLMAAANNVGADASLEAGRAVVIPHQMYRSASRAATR